MDETSPAEHARIVAAIDQLRATLSDVTGCAIIEPVVILAKERDHGGLLIFDSGLPDVPDFLRAAADIIGGGNPDVSIGSPE
jgi:hypothetical protein